RPAQARHVRHRFEILEQPHADREGAQPEQLIELFRQFRDGFAIERWRVGDGRCVVHGASPGPGARRLGIGAGSAQPSRPMTETPPGEISAALIDMGLLTPNAAVQGERLTGGVSSDIWRVDLPSGPICVKRALAKLRVAADW